jgi:hypothetical protein
MIADTRVYQSAMSVLVAPDRSAEKTGMRFRGEVEQEGRASGASGRQRCAVLTLSVPPRQDG